MEHIESKIKEIESKLHIVIPKVYREFLLAGHEMEFDDGILIELIVFSMSCQTELSRRRSCPPHGEPFPVHIPLRFRIHLY